MQIRDVMTTEVWSVRETTPLKEAAEILAGERISGLPVVDEQRYVVGVLSEGDILFKEQGAAKRKGLFASLLDLSVFGWLVDQNVSDSESKFWARTAGGAMTTPAITIRPTRSVSEAAHVMLERKVNRLPVVDEAGRLLGIVTRADLVRAFVRPDLEVEREIREDVLRRTMWIEPETVQVHVERGEVQLRGEVETKADAEMIPTYVARVPGVVSVLSKLSWRDDGSKEHVGENGRVQPWQEVR
jgi:CBS domain-containing protein